MGSFITTTMRTSVLFVVVFLISSNVLLFTRAQEEETFKVGLVRDVYLRYPWVDTYTYQGVQYWADWMNARGGLKYGNITRRIEVLTEDGSSLDTSQLAATIKGKYQKLINTYGCQLVVSPYGTSRTLAAMQGSDPLNVINLAFSSGLPALATLTTAPKKHVFSWGHRADVSSIQVAQYYSKLAKTMVLFCSTESGAQTFCNGAIKVFKDVGMTNLRTTYVNVSSVDSSDVLAAVVPRLRVAVDGIQPDLMVAVFLPDQFQGLMTAFESVKPNIKAAVLLSPLWTNIQHVPTELDNVGNGWVGITPFPYTIEVGSKDAFGGSSLEFVRGFEQKYGSPPIPFPAFAAGMLYSWTLAVQKAQSINTTLVEQAMIDMDEIYTVAGPLKFDGNHSNIYPKWYPFQLRGGEGVAITKIEDIVYPAPFPWLIQSTRTVEKVNVALVVGIVVPVGVVVIVGIIIAVIYTRRQRREAVQALHKSEEGERRNYKIDFDAIETQALLGSGSFGHVYKGEYRGTAVAIKKLKQQTMSKQQLDEFAREASVMVGLRHPNILLFMGVCLKPSNLCIITELMSRGSLYDVIVNKDIELSFSVKIRLALDALRGLQFIHSAGFIHRDLKSPNLLVDKSWNIKIADFGLSCAKGNAASNTQVSLLWTAPEVLEFETDSYTDKSDVYSFAIILWELMARKLPYEGMAPAAIHTAVVGGKRPPLDPSWGDQVCKVITDAWAQNPKNRPSIKDIRAVMESIPINENDNPMVLYNNTSSYSSGTRERFPKPPCAMVFVEVENEYKLWKNDPHMTLKALKMYGEVLRTQLKRVGGCESRSDDEAPSNANTFVAAFHDAVSAINFAMRVQSDLLQLEWPTGLANIPYTATEYSGADDLIYKGLRVSMGIHHGTPTVLTSGKEDKQVEYKGLIVSEGKQIARCAGGGQILLSGEVYNIISNNNQNQRLDPYVVETVTSIKLEKRTELLALYEVISKNLRERLGARSEYLEEIQRGSSIPSDPPVLLQEWIIPYEELKFGQLIGTGASGDVFSGFYNNQKVAIKQFVKQAIKDDLLLDMRAESATLYNIKHENVLKFIGMCTKHSHICLVTELMEKGDLASLLYKQKTTDLSWPVKMNIIADVAKGLANLHSINIIHRDIKSANIFIGNDWKARIGDFGFAVVKMANATMTQVGTVAWTCPEIFEGGTYSEKTDIYGFGVVLWEIVFGKKPWEGVHTMRIINYVLNGSRPPMTNPPSSTPPVILDLITACWHQDPTQRPSATEILSKLNVTGA